MEFNKEFIWGAASAAYQIEGAAYEDGKGLSVWDVLCQKKDAIANEDTGDTACNHFHLYKEDVKLMKEIGLQAYRFSISWPRVLPEGTGRINQKGLDFYDRLTDELLEAGIQPYVTLFHWDYPHELFKKGGWLHPDSSEWFAEYTKVIVDKLSDRVKNWMTFNEPQCFVKGGHVSGVHAPGIKLGIADSLQVAHNVLLSHGKSAKTIRQHSKQDCQVGFVTAAIPFFPETHSDADIEAARKRMFSSAEGSLWTNSWWLDPIYLGYYPEEGLEVFEKYLPNIKSDDMATINQPLDFFGVNIYSGTGIRQGMDEKSEQIMRKPGYARNSLDWEVTSEGFYWGMRYYYERYKTPIMVTENGLANLDWEMADGKVHDPQRIDYLYNYLRKMKKAIDDGVDVKGYFYWSIMDNFEWAEGYKQRFGLIYIDYNNYKRIIKDSGYWYRNVILSNGANLNGPLIIK